MRSTAGAIDPLLGQTLGQHRLLTASAVAAERRSTTS
jgi:hypothetical protein